MKPLIFALAWLACAAASAADWPQAGGNPQHTNFTPDSPAPPYQVAWVAEFGPELIYSATPVVAQGRVFQTTLNGHLYALDAATGKRLWWFRAGDCVWSAAAAGTDQHGAPGLVFVASWEGLIYALDAQSGREVWRFDSRENISAAPCVAQGMLFIATRKGRMLALTTEGKLQWETPLSWHVYNTAAHEQGKVFVLTEDMFLHCLDAKTGKPLWTSEKLNGMLMREFYPVVHKGKVMVTVTPAEYREAGGPWPFLGDSPDAKFKAIIDKYTRPVDPRKSAAGDERRCLLRPGELPPELEEAQQKLVKFYQQNPRFQTFYVLDQKDGKQAYHSVHHYSAGGLENVAMPPAVCADGTLAMNCMFGGSRLARFDIDKNRWVDFTFELSGSASDNSEFVAVGGSRIFSKNYIRGGHGQTAGFIMDLASREVVSLRSVPLKQPKRVSCLPACDSPPAPLAAGRLGDAGWGIGGTSPPVICENRLFWIKGIQQLIAYEGTVKP
jgi:hypothetical protein